MKCFYFLHTDNEIISYVCKQFVHKDYCAEKMKYILLQITAFVEIWRLCVEYNHTDIHYINTWTLAFMVQQHMAIGERYQCTKSIKSTPITWLQHRKWGQQLRYDGQANSGATCLLCLQPATKFKYDKWPEFQWFKRTISLLLVKTLSWTLKISSPMWCCIEYFL